MNTAVHVVVTGGHKVIIDREDAPLMDGFTWRTTKPTARGNRYAYTRVGGRKDSRTIYLHRLIMRPQDGEEVDHWNGNGLDNRRVNLRRCTHEDNTKNASTRLRGTSEYKGVRLYPECKRWAAVITSDRVKYNLGYFDTEIEAAQAYDRQAIILHGEFARLNFPGDSDSIDPDSLPEYKLRRRGLRTHCNRGHEYTRENTMLWRGKRKCRECDRINKKQRQVVAISGQVAERY